MKLRNKKTGEVVDVESLGHAESLKVRFGHQVTLSWATEYENLSQCKDYNSLAELNEDWEDYKPAEPLIKDEKVRKAVRAWADANDKRVYEVQVCYQSYGDGSWSLRDTTNEEDCGLAFIGKIPEELNLGSRYTITELCGEEEE